VKLAPPAAIITLCCACTDTEVVGVYPRSDDALTNVDASLVDSDAGREAGTWPPDDPSAHRGRVLLSETFDDVDYAERGWYDDPGGQLDEGVSGMAFACDMSGQAPCERPGRIPFEPQESLYVSYWLRFSESYELSAEVGQLFLLTDADPEYIGPAISHLTVTIVQTEGRAQIAVTDSANVDLDCVLLNDGSFNGCDGSFDEYAFSEERSVNACNGIHGDPTHTSCSPNDFGGFYSFRGFASKRQAFEDEPGARYKADWHFVEAVVQLNSVSGGEGQPDGRLRYWLDGEKLVDARELVLRTAEFADMHFQHLLIAPIALSAPDQMLFMDQLTVAVGLP
jgi:hypothetical protein